MDGIIKVAAIAVIGTLAALTLKKQNAESALLVALAAGIMILMTALSYVETVREFWEEISGAIPAAEAVSGPLLKSVGIAMLTKVTAELCRDGGEGALAAKTEFVGTAACLAVMLPLLREVLKLLAGML